MFYGARNVLLNGIFKKIIIALGFGAICYISVIILGTSDEQNWIDAGKGFTNAIATLNPHNTYVPEVSHRLGVTVLWVSSFIYLVAGWLPDYYILLLHRFIFLVINLCIFGLSVVILKKYFHASVMLFVIYMVLNRFFPILGRSTWLDQLLTGFGFLSILLWIRYLNTQKAIYVIYAGILSGLAMLTKYAGWYFPFIVVAISIIYSFRQSFRIQQLAHAVILFLIISLLIFISLYPAIWVDPYKVLFARWNETSSSINTVNVVGSYVSEFRLIDPILIFGFTFVIFDWIRKQNTRLLYLGIAGVLYTSIYIFTFSILFLTQKLDYAFLAGIYRYTYPALPFLALYFFNSYESYIQNKILRFLLLFVLFLREILLSPFFFFL